MQKKLKKFALILLASALTTVVGVSSATEMTSAKAVKATKLKMKKKKLSVNVGSKTKLGVTVKPKKATLKWKSNKKKIAAVSKKGVVTAKKQGTAKITVTSGKKKATCKVTVKQAYSISKIDIQDSRVVRVTLNTAKKLTAADFALHVKEDASGAYNNSLQIASVANTGNKTYDIVLAHTEESDEYATGNAIAEGEYVRVTIKKLNGVKVKEAKASFSPTPSNEYVRGMVGNKMKTTVFMGGNPTGYLSGMKVAGALPAGIKATIYPRSNKVLFSGTPTAIANGVRVVISGKDEKGRSISQQVYFYIGSTTQIVSYVDMEGRTFLTNNDNSKWFQIHAVGGESSYSYALTNNQNQFISMNGSEIAVQAYKYAADGKSKQYIAAGTYNLSYRVSDDEGHSTTGSVSLKAINGVSVTGKVSAADGTGIEDVEVCASFRNSQHTYYSSNCYGGTDKKGQYEIKVYPSQLYSMYASANDTTKYIENVRVGTAKTTRNFALPLYKVVFSATGVDFNNMTLRIYEDGEENHSYTSTYNGIVYLKKGTYTVKRYNYNYDDYDGYGYTTEGTGFNKIKVYTKIADKKFTVNGNMTVALTANQTKEPVYTINTGLTEGASKNVSDGYYEFTPAESGKYTFASSDDLSIRIYDINDDEGWLDSCYLDEYGSSSTPDYEFVAGQKYILRFYADGYDANITITKAE